jgi:hypothetical protein
MLLMTLFILSYTPQQLIAQGTSTFQTYTESGFTIKYPSDWSLEKNSVGIVNISPPGADVLYTFSNSMTIKEGVIILPPESTEHTTLEELARVALPSLLNSTLISDVALNEFSR